MRIARILQPAIVGTFGAALLGLVGCASAPPVAEKFVAPPMGTVDTFHRKSSGSLGNFDGKVVWTVAAATWQGRPAVSYGSPQAGTSLHEPASYALLGGLSPAGQPSFSYEPPLDYQWPLVVGRTWTTPVTLTRLPAGDKVPLTIDYKIEAWEEVTVPAGTFKAYRMSWRSSLGESETRWLLPQQGYQTLKRHVERTAAHPQGAGVLDAELLSRVPPAR